MTRLIRDGIMIWVLTIIISLAFAGGWMVLNNAHVILFKYGGMCFSYQCTPSLGSNLVFLFMTVLSLAISAGTMYFCSNMIVKIFKS